MGIFSPSLELPSELAPYFVGPPEGRPLKDAKNVVAKEAGSILQQMQPGNGEVFHVVAACVQGAEINPSAVVVTNRRTMVVKRGKVRADYSHGEVAETKLYTAPRNGGVLVVEVLTKTAVMDYAPNDYMRYGHILIVDVPTPRIANAICAAIDQYL